MHYIIIIIIRGLFYTRQFKNNHKMIIKVKILITLAITYHLANVRHHSDHFAYIEASTPYNSPLG